MTKNDKYIDIVQRLDYVAKAQQNFLSKINQTSRLSQAFDTLKTMESLMKELDKVNSLKIMLPQNVLKAPIIELARQANLSISKLSISSQIQPFIKEATKISDSWKKQIAAMTLETQTIEATLLGIQSQITRISEISLLAERSLTKLDFTNIGALRQISSKLRNSIRDAHFLFARSYSNLFSSLAEKEFTILSFAPVVSMLPPLELYYGNRFIEAISSAREDTNEESALVQELNRETTDELETYLKSLDPSLIRLWRGAKEASNLINPDAARHVATSLRELLTHVIHKLAPDDLVRAWSSSPEHYQNNRVTRRARLLFICKGINHDPFEVFVLKDIEALLACLDVFQKGTHAVDSSFTKSQIDFLISRVESFIRFLISTWKETGDT